MTEQETKTEEVKESIIGEFKPKRKFLNFVSAVNGAKIRFIRDIAFLRAEKLSGILDGVVFKITICDEGTINFEEVDTNRCDKAMIQRFIDELSETPTTGYAQKFVASGFEFTDVDDKRCYLEVEEKKPIDKLKALFDKPELSERGLSILDQLFGSDEDLNTLRMPVPEPVEEDYSMVADLSEDVSELKNESTSYMEESFRKMNEGKVIELKSRIEDKQKEIVQCNREISQSDKKLKESTEQLGVLETRLETMSLGDEPNGFVFYVSEEQKNELGLDENTKAIADKIADLMSLKKDVLFDYLTGGFYKIKIAKKDDITNQDFKLDKEAYEKISTLDVTGKMTVVDGSFEYRGTLTWHQLVSKMLRKGFEQNPDFDKLCQSNSYESKEELKDDHTCDDSCSHK